MSAYDPGSWHDFAAGLASAAAALAGLLFVAVSINLRAIVEHPYVPGRAGHALVLLATPVFLSLLLLIPQSAAPLAAELIVVAAVVGPVLLWLARPAHRPVDTPVAGWAAGVVAPAVALTLGIAVAGVGLVTTSLGGLYWLAAAVVLALASGLFNAWVLLVEIVR